MTVLTIFFLTLFLWTETLRAAVIKQNDSSSVELENKSTYDKPTLRPSVHQSEEEGQDVKRKPPGKGKPLSEKDFYNAKLLKISNPDYNKLDRNPTLKAGLFEGDIDGINISEIKSDEKNALMALSSHWIKATVPYTISDAFDSAARAVIAKAVQEFHSKTCIRFVPRTSDHTDYVNFMAGSGCYSRLGRVGGEQNLSLALDGCLYAGIIVHELMHAIGFLHEQNREDRDDYITIEWDNIEKDKEKNFDKFNWSVIKDLKDYSYDLNSVMHYKPYAFAMDESAPTIIPKVNGSFMGQRAGLSMIDVKKINALYRCPKNKRHEMASTKCADLDGQCVESAIRGECSEKPAWMVSNCMKTCGLCSALGFYASCNDLTPECPKWSKMGRCKQNPICMKTVCKKSCNACT